MKWVHFSLKWYLCVRNNPYALHPLYQKFTLRCLWISSNARPTGDGPLSSSSSSALSSTPLCSRRSMEWWPLCSRRSMEWWPICSRRSMEWWPLCSRRSMEWWSLCSRRSMEWRPLCSRRRWSDGLAAPGDRWSHGLSAPGDRWSDGLSAPGDRWSDGPGDLCPTLTSALPRRFSHLWGLLCPPICLLGHFPSLRHVQGSTPTGVFEGGYQKLTHTSVGFPFFTFCCQLIESVRMMACVVWLSPLEAIQWRACATACTSTVKVVCTIHGWHRLRGWWSMCEWMTGWMNELMN